MFVFRNFASSKNALPASVCTVFLLCLLLITGIRADASMQNPYKNVSFHTLKNGLSIVLAPGDKAENIDVKVRVKFGSRIEDKGSLGVSHLLEHLIFRDSRFNDEQTYLQLIKENGGKVNAYVQQDRTIYYALIPSEKGEWLVERFAEMLFEHDIDGEAITRAKSSVELEIGEPSWLANILGADILAPVFHRYFPKQGFFESEFGLSRPYYSMNEIKLSTRDLTQDQLNEYYLAYYRPSNMILFISGNFDKENMLSFINKTFGKYPDRKGKSMPLDNPEPSNTPYNRIQWFPYGSPNIYVGTKVLKPTARDQISLYIYLDYLSHRIMKELRNKRGETYTAKVLADERSGAGYGIVAFETQHPELNKNLSYVRSLIDSDTRNNSMTDEQIEEAIRITREQRFELADVDANTLMNYSEHYYEFIEEHGGKDSPYDVITSLTPDKFRASLPKLFQKDRSYTELFIPYIYSKIEFMFIMALSIVISIVTFQKILKRKIDETQIRWSQNMTYTPAMLFEIIICLILAFFTNHIVQAPVDRYISSAAWFHSASLWPEYIYISLSLFIFIGTFMCFLALFPRKLIIEDNTLVLKSMALYCRKFEKPAIKSVRSISFLKLIASPDIWLSFKFRFFYYSGLLWRKGLLLELHDRRTYFLDFRNADLVAAKLNELLLENQ